MKEKYKHSREDQLDTSPARIVPMLISMFKPSSVADVGCGVGNWLFEFQKNNVTDLLGIDGFHMDKNLFMLEQSQLHITNMDEPFSVHRKYDMAISLEVAEHIRKDSADTFITCLCNLSDTIIFSAAIPGQGGQNHVNEQWPSYWKEKFESKGFMFQDIIRPVIWNDEKIRYWYKQNMFVATRHPLPKNTMENRIMDVMHPEMLDVKMAESFKGEFGIRRALKSLLNSIRLAVRHTLGMNRNL